MDARPCNSRTPTYSSASDRPAMLVTRWTTCDASTAVAARSRAPTRRPRRDRRSGVESKRCGEQAVRGAFAHDSARSSIHSPEPGRRVGGSGSRAAAAVRATASRAANLTLAGPNMCALRRALRAGRPTFPRRTSYLHSWREEGPFLPSRTALFEEGLTTLRLGVDPGGAFRRFHRAAGDPRPDARWADAPMRCG